MTEGSSALVYIDANPLMYAFESGLENAKPIMALIEALKLRPGAGVTSEIHSANCSLPFADREACRLRTSAGFT